jgi:hypothetical protein
MPLALLRNNHPRCEELQQRAEAALGERLNGRTHYEQREIAKIEQLDKGLFPKNFEISSETEEMLRVLCTFSRCELRPAREIRSHRPYIGPLIVFLKRLSWPLIRFHLKDTFESLQFFSAKLVQSHAEQMYKLEVLKQELDKRQA